MEQNKSHFNYRFPIYSAAGPSRPFKKATPRSGVARRPTRPCRPTKPGRDIATAFNSRCYILLLIYSKYNPYIFKRNIKTDQNKTPNKISKTLTRSIKHKSDINK